MEYGYEGIFVFDILICSRIKILGSFLIIVVKMFLYTACK